MRFDWEEKMEYRSYLLFWCFVDTLPFIIMYFLWTFVYKGQGIIAGYSLSMMITYYLLSFFIERLLATGVDWNINNRINTGMFAQFLYQPLSHRLYYVSRSVSGVFFNFLVTLPVMTILILSLRQYLVPPSMQNVLFFVMAVIMSFSLNILLSWMVGYTAFWLEKANSLIYFRWSVIYYLSGQFIPLAFYGQRVEAFLSFLPFRYFYSFPIEIYLGKISEANIFTGFAIGFSWIVIFAVASFFIFARGLKKFSAVGN